MLLDGESVKSCTLLTARERTKWRRGLRLCFWSGHSHGRYSGSTWYVDQNWDELDRRCAVHVNVDSTGGIGATVLKNAAAAPELLAVGPADDYELVERTDVELPRRQGFEDRRGHRLSGGLPTSGRSLNRRTDR